MINTQKIVDNILGKIVVKRKVRQDHIVGYGTYKRDKLLPGGGYCDAGIYKFIVRIKNKGYITDSSCSGLISEHSDDEYSIKCVSDSPFGGFLSLENISLNILNVTIGTKWVGGIASKADDYHMYVNERDTKNKMLIKGVKKGKIKLLKLMPKGRFSVNFMLPSNLSDSEILYQWELLTRNIERL